jgi:hypothetical protein
MEEWITDHMGGKVMMSKQMTVFTSRWLPVKYTITDFAGTTNWGYRFVRRHDLNIHTQYNTKVLPEYENKVLWFHQIVINARNDS